MLNSKSIGSKIADLRKKNNLSQAELALQVSISAQAVGKWERGESMPDITTLNRVAGIFGVDLNYFSDDKPHQEVSNKKKEISETNYPKQTSWNWDMSEGNWNDADFSGLNNLQEKFSSSNIKNCKFTQADLSSLTLGKNNIELCDFSGSNMHESKIQTSNLLNNQFCKCLFTDAVFYKSNIEKCNFSEADFTGAEILEVNLERVLVNDVVWRSTKF